MIRNGPQDTMVANGQTELETAEDSFTLLVVIDNDFAVSPYEPGLMLWWRLGSLRAENIH